MHHSVPHQEPHSRWHPAQGGSGRRYLITCLRSRAQVGGAIASVAAVSKVEKVECKLYTEELLLAMHCSHTFTILFPISLILCFT